MSRDGDGGVLSATQTIRVVSELEGRRLTRGMLQHYTREGYVHPRRLVERTDTKGRPPVVGYDVRDVVLLRWLLRLNAQGVKVKRFASGICKLRRLVPDALRAPDKLQFFVVGVRDYAVKVPGKNAIQLTGTEGQVLLTFASHPDVAQTADHARRAQERVGLAR